jgi:prevent-host-death family protein
MISLEVMQMTTVGVSEAKKHFAKLLERVAEGESITITRDGVPVAELRPVGRKNSREQVEEAVQAIKELRARQQPWGNTRELIEEGRM